MALRKNKHKWISKTLKIVTWNVRELFNQEELTNLLKNIKVNIAAIIQTKKKLRGNNYVGNYIMFYSGVVQHERACKGVFI